LIFGVILTLVFVAPPFLLTRPEGELAILPPLAGFSLFAPLPILYGWVVAAAVNRLEAKYHNAPQRRVGVAWFGLFSLALLLGFMSTLSLVESSPFPPAIARAIQQSGISFRAARAANTALLVLYGLAYCGLAALIFLRASHAWMPKFTALTLLLFAGAFFNRGQFLGIPMTALPIASLVIGLVRTLGFLALLLLFYLFPDGRFAPRWTRPLAVAASLWALVWFLNPLPGSPLDPNTWPTLAPLGVVIGFLATGPLAQLERYQQSPQQRPQTRWAVLGMAGAVLAFSLLALASVLIPDLKPRNLAEWPALFAFAIYLTPWLLIPLSIGLAMRTGQLWRPEIQ
ncbi:MAG: hypothetical protein ACRDH2_15575, partial [Anaerolineales bacterium]